MAKNVSFENMDKLVQLGIAISTLRRIRGLTQADLAEKVGISRDTVRAIESSSVIRSFSFETFLKIAYVLDIKPEALIKASVFDDGVIRKEQK
ncbi:MAG: helix-turn-helix transcriptional regulator [Ruminococcaceae bacterium]|nr:helix-turn-helix transcriptional regulator [Oscillospiraceae bacterium]